MRKHKIHSIILARGGSKGIKNKNIININNKPLIYWSIKTSLKSKMISNTWVSSDNLKILKLAKKFGAIIILRPRKLSKDTSTSDEAWFHAVKEIKKRYEITHVVGIQPTSAIREPKDFDKALNKFFKEKYDSLFSASKKDGAFSWIIGNKLKPNYNLKFRPRRQDLPLKISENGSFYIFSVEKFLRKKNRLFGRIGYHLLERYKSFEIDTLEDIPIVESILRSFSKKI